MAIMRYKIEGLEGTFEEEVPTSWGATRRQKRLGEKPDYSHLSARERAEMVIDWFNDTRSLAERRRTLVEVIGEPTS